MSDANNPNSRRKGCFSVVFVLFLLGIISKISGCDESPRLDGKFYGYSPPSTTTFGSTTVQVGPVLYEVQFDYGEKESDNIIKVKLQELKKYYIC